MMRDSFKSKRRASERGQGLTEYIVLLGLIALVAYAVVKTLGADVQNAFNNADMKMNDMANGWGNNG